mmetsp:Transcript_10881/g.21323  ORF Transcript_10881/g.21323 Transcript_10881/m.21323 type:complete len:123 (-) Transcript_10881:370-738(-)
MGEVEKLVKVDATVRKLLKRALLLELGLLLEREFYGLLCLYHRQYPASLLSKPQHKNKSQSSINYHYHNPIGPSQLKVSCNKEAASHDHQELIKQLNVSCRTLILNLKRSSTSIKHLQMIGN